MPLIDIGERFGQLECIGLVSGPEDEEERYRVRCHKCRSDSVTASADALLAGQARMCWDCRQFAQMTPQQRAALAFRRSLHLSPPSEELDRVDTLPTASPRLTVGEALAA